MFRVGITGGIGSGKSIICDVFGALGIPVFRADDASRLLVDTNRQLIKGIKALFGDDIYIDGKLDRPKVSAIVYNDPAQLASLNALVHPATLAYGEAWNLKQSSVYTLKEAAIFFESGSFKDIDCMIGVYAPEELRVSRAMKRSSMSREQVVAVISRQMNEEEKMKRCDYVIINDDVTPVLPQVLLIHEELLKKADQAH